jgi:lysophospholipase L1-like esterase
MREHDRNVWGASRGSRDARVSMAPAHRRLECGLKRLGLAVASIVLTLAIAEAVLRVSGIGMVRPELDFGVNARPAFERGQFVVDRQLFWKYSGARTPLDEALGAVHPDRAIAPPTGRPRLLFLGDSCTRLGLDGLAYPGLLKSQFGDDAEVLTAAVPGYSSHQGLVWLRRQLLAAHPDVLVVYFGWNDHWRTLGRTDRQYAASLSIWRPRLANLWRRRAASPPVRVPPPDYRENLTAIATEAANAGIRVLFIRAPASIGEPARQQLAQAGYLLPGDDPNALHETHLRVLDEVASDTNTRVLDAAAIFARLGSARPLMGADGIHLTGIGHRVMAAIVAQTIFRDILQLIDDPRSPDEVAAAECAPAP